MPKFFFAFLIAALSLPVCAGAKAAKPVLLPGHSPMPEISAASYIVIDRGSGRTLAELDPDGMRPIASLTKMMTGLVVADKKVPLGRLQAITAAHKVGGSALNLKNGTKLTVGDLFYAAFMASANDATNALADSAKLTKEKFVAAMNAKAKKLGLANTRFADPTGIDDRNISTPRDLAALAKSAFANATIRRAMLTAKRSLTAYPSKKKVAIKNSDGMLWKPEYDGVLVGGGKTGYLGPSGGWNLAVSLRDAGKKSAPELMVVVMGEPMLKTAQSDAEAMARWAWSSYAWK